MTVPSTPSPSDVSPSSNPTHEPSPLILTKIHFLGTIVEKPCAETKEGEKIYFRLQAQNRFIHGYFASRTHRKKPTLNTPNRKPTRLALSAVNVAAESL